MTHSSRCRITILIISIKRTRYLDKILIKFFLMIFLVEVKRKTLIKCTLMTQKPLSQRLEK